jgi:hypothetical protein
VPAELAIPDLAQANLLGALIDRLVGALDRIGSSQSETYLDVFQALATAVDVAEALSRRGQA